MAEKIYGAISKVMEDVGSVGKNGVNTYDKYKFRGIDDVMNALNPAMIKNKVFVTPEVLDCTREERQSKTGGNMIYTTLKVKYTFYTDDGSNVTSTTIGEAADRSDKSTNKAMSAAFKYACCETFCIPTEDMQDADAESPEIGEKVNPKPSREEIEADAKKRAAQMKEHNDRVEGWVKQIRAEMQKTGVAEEKILTRYEIESLNDVDENMFNSIMRAFKLTEKSNAEKAKGAGENKAG